MNSQQQTKKVTKNDIFQCVCVCVCFVFVLLLFFFENPANMTTMYSEHLQHHKRSRLPETVYVADFLRRNICLKTFVFLISQSS